MERHYCYSCKVEHMFLDEGEWRAIEPLVKQALLLQDRQARIARRKPKEPRAPDLWIPALEAFNRLTGEAVPHGYSLLHRQLIHTGKWKPRGPDGCPLPEKPEGAA